MMSRSVVRGLSAIALLVLGGVLATGCGSEGGTASPAVAQESGQPDQSAHEPTGAGDPFAPHRRPQPELAQTDEPERGEDDNGDNPDDGSAAEDAEPADEEPADSEGTSPAEADEPATVDEADNPLAADGGDEPQEPVDEHPFQRRIEAPPLDGGLAWINTAGPLEIRDLRGKFVLLDFWTYCCINCIHILPELKKLEQAYPNEIVVIGVHSAKFDTEEDSRNITEAVLRYEIEHPVVNDAEMRIWDNYGISSWPSLRIIDPEGNLVAGHGGEIDFESLDQFFQQALPYYRKKGLLDETPVHFDLEKYAAATTPLRFPGKVLADEAGNRLFIADSNHNRLVVTRLDGTVLDVIGSGAIGAADGGYAAASFNKPQGMALADENTLYVADTENHLLRKVDLLTQRVTTVAGTGVKGQNPWPGIERGEFGQVTLPARFVGPPATTEINSPWDVLVHEDALYIAMAGPHQIWKMTLDETEIGPYAGNGREDIIDGELLPEQPYEPGFSSFAQPSGLSSDGEWLYVADSEGSSIRRVPFDPAADVGTVVGTAHLRSGRLFAFGDIDGTGENVRLQHPLAVVHHDGLLYVADTYNNKIKTVDPAGPTLATLAGTGEPGTADEPPQFDEPAGLSYAAGKLYVADTNNHLIRVIDLEDGNRATTLEIAGLSPPELPESEPPAADDHAEKIDVAAQRVQAADGTLRLAVKVTLPDGYKINGRAPMSYAVEAEGDAGLIDRTALGTRQKVTPPAAEFEIALPLSAEEGSDTLRVSLRYFYCQEGDGGLCKVGAVVWTVPVEVGAEGEGSVELRLMVE